MSFPAAVMPTPSAAWFQQAAHARTAKNALIQQYHIKGNENTNTHRQSYGALSRTEKLSSAVRDALERNGSAEIMAIERNAAEGRVETLHTKTHESRQEADNFVNVLIGSKENRIAQAREVSDQKISGLKSVIELEFETLDSEATKGRDAIREMTLLSANMWQEVKDQNSKTNGNVLESQEIGISRIELEQLRSQFCAEKDTNFLAVQLEKTQADTNRRMVDDRAANDSRVEAVTAAATLQEAENHTKVLLYEIQTSGATARAAYEAKQLLRTTTAQTEQVVAASAATSSRDALAAARAEAAILRSRSRS